MTRLTALYSGQFETFRPGVAYQTDGCNDLEWEGTETGAISMNVTAKSGRSRISTSSVLSDSTSRVFIQPCLVMRRSDTYMLPTGTGQQLPPARLLIQSEPGAPRELDAQMIP